MRRRSRFKLKIYDESHLIDIGEFRISWLRLALGILGLLVFFTAIGIVLVGFTPINRILPGYMQREQRLRTEEAYLKVDSLQHLYSLHRDYLDNLEKILDTERTPDIPDTVGNPLPLIVDSIMVSSEIEREFIKKMEDAGYIIEITTDYKENGKEISQEP